MQPITMTNTMNLSPPAESAEDLKVCPDYDGRRRSGFTMAELLVVVAIIAVLVAIAIPVFSAQLEKSRRAVDLANSRDVIAALKVGYLSGDIDFPESKASNGSPTCIVVISNHEATTSGEGESSHEVSAVRYMVSGSVKVNGKDYEGDGNDPNYRRLKNYFASCGIDVTGNGLATKATGGDGGWKSWSVIMQSDGSTRVVSFDEPVTDIDTIANGAVERWAAEQFAIDGETNIEKAYGGQG